MQVFVEEADHFFLESENFFKANLAYAKFLFFPNSLIIRKMLKFQKFA